MWICFYFCLALSFNILRADKFNWEDYDGNIPEKAFSVSDDPNEKVYVGMTEVGQEDKKENCTGSLYPGDTELIVECKDKIYKATCLQNIKILTIEDPTKVIWMHRSTNAQRSYMWDDFKKKGVSVVHSGKSNFRKKTTTMVGRGKVEGGTATVIAGHVNEGIFRAVHGGLKTTRLMDYDILTIKKD